MYLVVVILEPSLLFKDLIGIAFNILVQFQKIWFAFIVSLYATRPWLICLLFFYSFLA